MERTTAATDAGNIRVSRHEEVNLDGGVGAVAKAAVHHGAVETAAAGSIAAGTGSVSLQEEEEEKEEEED